MGLARLRVVDGWTSMGGDYVVYKIVCEMDERMWGEIGEGDCMK